MFFISSGIYAGDYFFYYSGKKIFMQRDDNYMVVKFNPDLSSSACMNIINQKVGTSAEKSSEFAPGSSVSKYIILKIKGNTNTDNINSIRVGLMNAPQVSNVGMCFPGRGKMKHYTTNEIIVKFKKNTSQFQIDNANRLFKTTVLEKVDNFENVYLLAIESKGEESSDNVFDVSNRYTLLNDMVEFAQPNFIREGMLLSNESVPPPLTNDTMVTKMWDIKNTGHNIPDSVIGIPGCDGNIDSAWAITTGDPNVLIAIVDTGVDTNHIDLRGNLCDRSLWYDAVDNNQKPFDQYYHGTAVAGITNAIGNNIAGTVGVAYTSKFIPIRVFGPFPQGYTTDLILGKGVNWAWKNGACIINCSWGGGITTPLISMAIQDAVHFGRSGRGTIVFAGSGNDNQDSILYPAVMPEVIGVGGLSPCNQRKSLLSCDNVRPGQDWGASYGENLSVVAPCTYIGVTELGGSWCLCGNGTSDSSPFAAGIGALILSKNINLSADSVKIIIERSARKVGNYSYNIPKQNGLWNNEMGYGRVDAKVALDMTPAGPQFIADQVAPKIDVFPPESGFLVNETRCYALIIDNVKVSDGNNSPRLYYYTNNFGQLSIIPAVMTGSYSYKFVLPRLPYGVSMHYYVAAQDDNGNNITFPYGGKGSNPPGSVRPHKMLFLRNTLKYDTNIIATDIPKPINSPFGVTIYSIYHNNNSRQILDVDCWFNINHNYDLDLTMSLISPSGTEIVLAGGVGDTAQNFVNTYLDDEADMQIDSSTAHAPFTGHFRPVQKLWLLDGENSWGDWKLKVVDNGYGDVGELKSWGMKFTFSSTGDFNDVPGRFALLKNYPNPFNPTTRILFNVPRTARIKIVLYDLTGREVKVLLNELRGPAVEDYVDLDANSLTVGNRSGIASGVYFYSMYADGEYIESKKMMLIK